METKIITRKIVTSKNFRVEEEDDYSWGFTIQTQQGVPLQIFGVDNKEQLKELSELLIEMLK